LALIIKDGALPEHFLGFLKNPQRQFLFLARGANARCATDAQTGIENSEVEQVGLDTLLKIGFRRELGVRRQTTHDRLAFLPEFKTGTFDVAKIGPRQEINSVEQAKTICNAVQLAGRLSAEGVV